MSDTALQAYHGSYLMPSLAEATVADAMHPGILTCDPGTALTDVARLMAVRRVHCVAVMHPPHDRSSEPYVWGIVSDLDLLRAHLGDGAQDTAGDAARQPAISVKATMALRDAARLMVTHQVSHLVVVHADTLRPVGVISTLDVAGVLAWGTE